MEHCLKLGHLSRRERMPAAPAKSAKDQLCAHFMHKKIQFHVHLHMQIKFICGKHTLLHLFSRGQGQSHQVAGAITLQVVGSVPLRDLHSKISQIREL